MELSLKCIRTVGGKNHELLTSYNDHQAGFYEDQKDLFSKIEKAISDTNDMGKMPLWKGYGDVPNYPTRVGPNAKRTMGQVRTTRGTCQFYAWLASKLKPQSVLEFGAAFGASGMYWLAGLEIAKAGTLFSFEPNEIWCDVARKNFEMVSDKFVLTAGTFEDNTGLISPKADITLIDAIHTKDFVLSQFELVKAVSAPGAIILFDDISFSNDMRACWQEIKASPDAVSVWQISSRVGIIELA